MIKVVMKRAEINSLRTKRKESNSRKNEYNKKRKENKIEKEIKKRSNKN
jgi:hypothetical protein